MFAIKWRPTVPTVTNIPRNSPSRRPYLPAMESQDFFPHSDWDLQAPQHSRQPIHGGVCGCHDYMPPGEHNPFEHGVKPFQLEDFEGPAPGSLPKNATREDYKIIAREIEAQNAAAAKEQAASNAAAAKQRAKQRHLLELEQKGGIELRSLAEALEGESRRSDLCDSLRNMNRADVLLTAPSSPAVDRSRF